MSDNNFKPYIPAEKSLPEFTATSVILGILLAVLFGGANAYLGLRVGMTVSASIPAAVISMGVIRVILKKDSVLENNMVQTIGSAGESVAAGAIFTMPALFLWASEWGTSAPSLVEIAIIAAIGGSLGVLFMVPLRKALIVQEHGVLPYPEGQACAEVLLAGEEGGEKAGIVFKGLGLAAAYKFVTDGLKLFPSEVHYEIPAYKGSGVGIDVLPALLGVGYICGTKISSYLFAGGVLGWFVLMPLIVLFGQNVTLFPASVSVAELYAVGGSFAIWSNYIKYIGAGAVAAGGVISLIKSLPLIIRTFRDAMKGYGKGNAGSDLRTDKDLPMKAIILGVVALALLIWLVSSGTRTMQFSAAVSILAAIVVGFLNKEERLTVGKVIEALEAGAKGAITVAVACAMAGMIAGCITVTGLASILINTIVQAAGNATIIGLVLTMVCCIILGMGVPTTANYCIMASTCAPILIQMGFPVVAAHFFVFYFGIVADITPPVALAAYAGAAIAKANPMKTGFNATKLAIAAFVVPYIFAYSPAMLFVDVNSTFEVIQIVLSALLGLFGIAASLNGYLFKHLPWLFRIILIGGGLGMMIPGTMSDLAGFVLVGGVVLLQYLSAKKEIA